ncbi:MAG: hypothetical protein R2800_03950 [Flavipsychrobacter sp.]
MRIITRTLGYDPYTLRIEEHLTDTHKGVYYRICELTVHKGFTQIGKHKGKSPEECIDQATFHYGVPKDYWQYADVHDSAAKIESVSDQLLANQQLLYAYNKYKILDYTLAPFISKHKKSLTIIFSFLTAIWLAILIYALTHKVEATTEDTVIPTTEHNEDLDFVEQPEFNRVLLLYKLDDSITHIDTIHL